MKFLYENEILILVAEEGYKLTEGTTFVSQVRLGKDASIGEWKEITNEEAEVLKEELSKEE